MAPLILVVGATGNTGKATVKFLLQKGFPVRAFVHKIDERSGELEALGAEILAGDILDLRDVRRAFQGVKRAYFVYPVSPGLIEATAKFAEAALEANAELIVNMSQRPSGADLASNASLNHWVAERVFDRGGTPVVHLQPTAFNELLLATRAFIKKGRYAVPFSPDGRFAPVSGEDIAELTAAIIADPSGHVGKRYQLFGPVEMTPPDVAAILSKTLGKDIRYEPVSTNWLKEATSLDLPYLDQHFGAVFGMHRDGHLSGTNDVFEKIIGRRPESIAEFVEKHRAAFL